jgi:hypothetical protein
MATKSIVIAFLSSCPFHDPLLVLGRRTFSAVLTPYPSILVMRPPTLVAGGGLGRVAVLLPTAEFRNWNRKVVLNATNEESTVESVDL